MNRAEARRIARDLAAELREIDPEQLRAAYCGRPLCRVVFGHAGVTYQVEVRAEPEDESGRELRVMVTVDDGGGDPAGPVVEDFLADPSRRLTADCPSR